MKWFKTAIVIVIVISIMPSIVKSINDLEGGGGYQGEYEIIFTDENINEATQELLNLVEIDENGNVTNYISVEADGNNIDVYEFSLFNNEYFYIGDAEYNFMYNLDLENPSLEPVISDYLKITLYVNIESEKPLLSPALISLLTLIPLIMISGILIYLNNKIRNR